MTDDGVDMLPYGHVPKFHVGGTDAEWPWDSSEFLCDSSQLVLCWDPSAIPGPDMLGNA